MALSNIFREPRREITETALGLIPAAIVGFADYQLALFIQDPKELPFPLALVVGFFMIGIGIAAMCFMLFLTHSAGEWICNRLADRGLELRPKQRYR